MYLIYAGSRGYTDEVAVEDISRWSRDFVRYMDTAASNVGDMLKSGRVWNDDTEAALQQAIKDFNASWSA